MNFHKYHALGNDYLVLDAEDFPNIPSKEQIQKICHRNLGLGSDGILYGPIKSQNSDYGLKIFNPDGSEAEKSGNGLRIFSRYLFDIGKLKNNNFSIETLGGKVFVKINDPIDSISIEMGIVKFLGKLNLKINGSNYLSYIVNIGNPHCIIPQKKISKKTTIEDGPIIETHSEFPNRTIVQFLEILDRKNIKIEIWERGAGYTLASGSSSSAAAAVANHIGECDNEIKVHMPGGVLFITILSNQSIIMTGPTSKVGIFTLDNKFL